MREGRIGGWKIISHQDNYGGIFEMSSVIFEIADDFWYLYVDRNKLMDVMNMPSYIVEDWLWVSRKVIDEKTIGYHIERAEKDVKHQTKKHQSLMKSPISHVINEKSSEKDITTAEEKLALLLSIQRSIRIDRIIS
jgi:hypothetical protein